MVSEQPDGVTVAGWRPPAFYHADVLRDVDAGPDVALSGLTTGAEAAMAAPQVSVARLGAWVELGYDEFAMA